MIDDRFVGYKVLRFPERLAEWMRTGTTSAPIVVDFDLTNRCSQNCPRCPGQWRLDPSAQLSTPEAQNYIRQFADMGLLAMSFGGGGDPLAHPDCAHILEFARRSGLAVGVITNGVLLDRLKAAALGECAQWVRVSLDAARPATFSRVHGAAESQFDLVCTHIGELACADRTCVVGVGFLTDAATEQEMIEGAGLARNLGADYIQFRPYNNDLTDVRQTIRRAQQLYESDSFRVLASWPKYDLMVGGYTKPYKVCRFHHFAAVTTAKGDVQFCCDMRGPDGCIGSLRQQPMASIWKSGRREDLAARLDLSGCPPLCRGNAQNILLSKIAEPISDEVFL